MHVVKQTDDVYILLRTSMIATENKLPRNMIFFYLLSDFKKTHQQQKKSLKCTCQSYIKLVYFKTPAFTPNYVDFWCQNVCMFWMLMKNDYSLIENCFLPVYHFSAISSFDVHFQPMAIYRVWTAWCTSAHLGTWIMIMKKIHYARPSFSKGV